MKKSLKHETKRKVVKLIIAIFMGGVMSLLDYFFADATWCTVVKLILGGGMLFLLLNLLSIPGTSGTNKSDKDV
jgi:VIT1/CCC1 family predicted Fe2+/Mn2+ transporter